MPTIAPVISKGGAIKYAFTKLKEPLAYFEWDTKEILKFTHVFTICGVPYAYFYTYTKEKEYTKGKEKLIQMNLAKKVGENVQATYEDIGWIGVQNPSAIKLFNDEHAPNRFWERAFNVVGSTHIGGFGFEVALKSSMDGYARMIANQAVEINYRQLNMSEMKAFCGLLNVLAEEEYQNDFAEKMGVVNNINAFKEQMSGQDFLWQTIEGKAYRKIIWKSITKGDESSDWNWGVNRKREKALNNLWVGFLLDPENYVWQDIDTEDGVGKVVWAGYKDASDIVEPTPL